MKRRCSRLLAAAAAFALSVQSTGAASLPVALMTPRAAFPPPAARFAAFPAKPAAAVAPAAAKAPAGPSWLDSARVVADFVLDRVREESAPLSESPAAPAPAPDRVEPAAVAAEAAPLITPPAPGVNAPADRMMVVMEPGKSVEAVLGSGDQDFSARPAVPGPVRDLPPFREGWLEKDGVRARVSYLRSHGVIKVDDAGFTAEFADGTVRRAPNRNLPAAYRRDFPIYFHDETIEIEATIENKTGRTLHDVRLEAVQETFRPVGTEGARLEPAVDVPVAKTLAPGERITVRWRARLGGPAHAAVNLEQTHVRVMGDGQAAALLDAPQAGVIDPPGPGWN